MSTSEKKTKLEVWQQEVKSSQSVTATCPAVSPGRGSWGRGRSPESVAARPAAPGRPRPGPGSAACRFSPSLCGPGRLLGPPWMPWLWQLTRRVRTRCLGRRSGSGSRTRGPRAACGWLAGPWCLWVARRRTPASPCTTPRSSAGPRSGPGSGPGRRPTPASTPLPCTGGWRRAAAAPAPAPEGLTSNWRAEELWRSFSLSLGPPPRHSCLWLALHTATTHQDNFISCTDGWATGFNILHRVTQNHKYIQLR